MKAGIYIRVSSAEQALEGYSVGSQTDKLQAYCMAMGYDIYNVYTDPGFTGANIDRPAMKKLINDVENKKIDIVLVMKLDRLSRSQKDTLYLIEDVFLKNGCEFVSVTESFDTSSPMGRAFIGILAVFAQFERERISERTMDGKIERAKSGKAMGWYKVPIGYNYVNKEYIVDPYESELVKRIYNLAEEGYSMVKIKKFIDDEFTSGTKYKTKDGKYHVKTIREILRNTVYIGKVRFNKESFDGIHDAIITEEQFNKVQNIREIKNKNALGSRKNPFKSTHILSGFLYCGICGARMHAQTRQRINNSRSYYICYSVSKTTSKYTIDPNCNLKIIDGETLDNYIISEILNLKLDKSKFNEITENAEEDETLKDAILIKLKGLDNKINKLMDLYLNDIFDKQELEKRNEQLINEKKSLEKELENATKTIRKLSKKEAVKVINNAELVFENGTLDQKKSLISSLIDRIVIDNDSIKIYWTFV
jgi:site-specific DNA recombinase